MPEETLTAAPPVETDAASSTAEVETTATDTETPDTSVEETPAEESSAPEQTESEETESPQPDAEEDILADFQGSIGAQLRELAKQAPGLTDILNKFPNVRNAIANKFRREAAFSEVWGTVAEARAMRDAFPRGVEDVNHVMQELDELGQIDGAFYGGKTGDMIAHMEKADRQATVSLLKEAPKHLARLDPDAYSELFSGILGTTLQHNRTRGLDPIRRAYERAKANGDTESQNDLADAFNYLNSFGQKRTDDSPEAKRLREREAEFERRQTASEKQDTDRFVSSFSSESEKMQRQIVEQSALFKKLPSSVKPEKRTRMMNDVMSRVRAHLEASRPFMTQIRSAYLSKDLKACLEIQKGAWKEWVVNRFVRQVLAEETPAIIQGNNAANAAKRAAAANTRIATSSSRRPQTPAAGKDKRTRPSEYTMEEIMSGKVPDEVMDAYINSQRVRGRGAA